MKGIIPQGRALDPESPLATPFRGRAAGYETMLSLHSFGNEQVQSSRRRAHARRPLTEPCERVRTRLLMSVVFILSSLIHRESILTQILQKIAVGKSLMHGVGFGRSPYT